MRKLFRDGGTCATPMTPAQFVEAHRRGRMRRLYNQSLALLGGDYLLHWSRPPAKWGMRVRTGQ